MKTYLYQLNFNKYTTTLNYFENYPICLINTIIINFEYSDCGFDSLMRSILFSDQLTSLNFFRAINHRIARSTLRMKSVISKWYGKNWQRFQSGVTWWWVKIACLKVLWIVLQISLSIPVHSCRILKPSTRMSISLVFPQRAKRKVLIR